MTITPFDLLIFIIILGLVFDYTNGFHDAANVVSTVIATKVLAPISAIVLASFLNFLGATQISRVAKTITTDLVSSSATTPIIILCALIGAILWNLITWYVAIPSSSSYALVGGLVGACWMQAGKQSILFNGIVHKVVIPMVISPLIGFLLGFLLMRVLSKSKLDKNKAIFSHLQIFSASLVALAHGFNDAQKSMAIITLGLFSAGIITETSIPFWVIAACALMMGLGTAFGGLRIIRTVSYKITSLEPMQGFAAETSASCVIFIASLLGMPVSSTHMIVGSITGVGASKKWSEVSWGIMKKLVIAWVLTLPGSAIIAALIAFLFTRYN